MKAAFIIQRYGLEINGGAELQARLIAQNLSTYWDIDILTTCALDYTSWSNHYKPGVEFIEGIKVHRFETDYTRPINTFNKCYDLLVNLHLLQKNSDRCLSQGDYLDTLFSENGQFISPLDIDIVNSLNTIESLWMRLQGPYSSTFLKYLNETKDIYDVFIFFTATYATTYFGLPIVQNKSILVPELHRDACMAFNIFSEFFSLPKFLIFNTKEEKLLAHEVFPQTKNTPHEVAGIGIKESSFHEIKMDKDFIDQFDFSYILYLGRIEPSKGCLDLAEFFIEYKNRYPKNNLKLVLAGKKHCEMPYHQDILYPGFVTENQKILLLKKAKIFIMPSEYESLSISLLEAWTLNTPAITNGKSHVLRGHCIRSGAGFYYENKEDFIYLLDLLIDREYLQEGMGTKGKKYVLGNYHWNNIIEKYQSSAKSITQGNVKNLDIKKLHLSRSEQV